MILNIGVKTISPQLVTYIKLMPYEKEVDLYVELNAKLHKKGVNTKEPTMIIYYDPKESPDPRREIMIGVEKKLKGIPTKQLPKIKAAFIVYINTNKKVSNYYCNLRNYIKQNKLKESNKFYSIEAIYPPTQYNLSYGSIIEEDAQERWTTEILIPIEG